MNCLMWNCRGANKPNFRRSIRYLLKKFKTDVLAIFETHVGGENAVRICRGLGFENNFRVDAVGQSGDLWLLWRSGIGEVKIVEHSDQFIYATVEIGTEMLNLIAVYAAPTVSRRNGLWGRLKDVVKDLVGPIVIGGDFNTIVRLDERTGGNGRLSPDSIAFGDWINELSLIDMGFQGNQYTWRRGRAENTLIAKRLDRVLCCAHARLKWQEATVSHLPMLASDHVPLYVQLVPEIKGNANRRPFRFEAAWLNHPEFKELLKTSCDRNINTREALKRLEGRLRKWNKEVFGDVQIRKEKLMREIKEVQQKIDHGCTDALLEQEGELVKEFGVILEQEEMIWFQKSRVKWVVHGDRNTKFFHTSTIIRRRRNRIESLKADDGSWVSGSHELEHLAVEYFTRLYSLMDLSQGVQVLPSRWCARLSSEDQVRLSKPFSSLEIEKAVRSMGKYKAPGPDGFQPVFYQEYWEEVGESAVRFVMEFFESGTLPPETNDAIVVLIPKVAHPEKITQFRPISLCNVLLKL